MKTGGVLALCSFKTRAEKKARKTEEFYKITSLIASVGDRIDSSNCHQESVIL